jgi:hypothetical protein
VPNVVRNPYSNTAGNTPSSLGNGVIAVNQADGKLFYRSSAGVVTALATSGGSTSVYEYATESLFPATGAANTIYIDKDTSRAFRWTNSVYVEISAPGAESTLFSYFLPPAPTSVTATPGNAQATVAWTAPTVSAQIPITNYTVQYSSNSGSSWTTVSRSASTATSATVTGLTNGTAYTFRVAAVNGLGTGAYSTVSAAVTPSFPASIAGLQLLLDASFAPSLFQNSNGTTAATATDNPVGYWADMSGLGNHATQATSGARPLLKLSNQNGLPGLLLDGTDDFLTASVAGFQSLTAVTVIMVFKSLSAAAADTNTASFWGFGHVGPASGSYPAERGVFAGSNAGAFSGEKIVIGVVNPGVSNGRLGASGYTRAANTAQSLAITLTSSGSSMFANNNSVSLDLIQSGYSTTTGYTPALTGYTVDDDLHIGAIRASGVLFITPQITIYEVLVYNRALTSGERASLNTYLAAKWGIS